MATREEISDFSTKILEMADEQGQPCMDVIVQYCDETGIEVEVAATLVSSFLKARIREEAQSVNLIKKAAKLPL
jgi:hypothetical protein